MTGTLTLCTFVFLIQPMRRILPEFINSKIHFYFHVLVWKVLPSEVSWFLLARWQLFVDIIICAFVGIKSVRMKTSVSVSEVLGPRNQRWWILKREDGDSEILNNFLEQESKVAWLSLTSQPAWDLHPRLSVLLCIMLRNTDLPIFWMTQRTRLCGTKQMSMNSKSKKRFKKVRRRKWRSFTDTLTNVSVLPFFILFMYKSHMWSKLMSNQVWKS